MPLLPQFIGGRYEFEEAWKFFILMEATEWRFLPDPGGLNEQDPVLLENIFAIRNTVRRIRSMNNA